MIVMKEKTFYRLLAVILILGSLFTVGHMCYAVYVYRQSSVIYYVGEEYWP